ncbi:hypothetical protein DFP73DRAFT_606368 [Morchella snyderi]|nr:hypothetical protein DFP73DRAFT_606368 [Morchella snyderi]
MHLATGTVNVTFDGLCWVFLLFRIVAIWSLFPDQGRGGKVDGKSQGYGLFLIVLSFIGWTIGSFPYLMNVGESIFVRMIPYIITLSLALGVLGCFPSIVFSVPIYRSNESYNRKLGRFGSSPPNISRAGQSITSPNFNPGDIESSKINRFPSHAVDIDRNFNDARTSMMFRSIIGAPIVHPGTAIPWSLEANNAESITRPKPVKAMPENRRPSIAPSHGAKHSVSNTMGLRETNSSFDAVDRISGIPKSNSFGKMRTVSLKTAAEAERQRIDAVFEREKERKNSNAGTVIMSKSATDRLSTENSTSVKRKPLLPQLPSGAAAFRVSAVKREGGGPASSSSLRRSEFAAAEGGSDWGTRYSMGSLGTEDDDTTRYTAISHAPYTLAAPPRISKINLLEDGSRVMFLNEIVYDDPALVKSIMGKTDIASTTSRYSGSKTGAVRRSPSSVAERLPGLLPAKSSNDSVVFSPPFMDASPVMDRPRSVKNIAERGIFPPNRDSDLAAQMQYNKRQSNIRRESELQQVDSKPLPEVPTQRIGTEKKRAREIMFPIPPPRATTRKGAPPPITITIPNILSPEIIQEITAASKVEITQSIPSPKPAIPEKSEKRLMSPTINDQRADFVAYETAKAWAESVSAASAKPIYAESIIEPLPSIAYDMSDDITPRVAAAISDGNHKRKSLIALTVSPLFQIEDDAFTDIEIDSDSEDGGDQDPEAANMESVSDEQTQSEADEMIASGGEGYSTEDESYEDFFTDSEEGCYLDDAILISGMEEGSYDKITATEQKLDAKVQENTEILTNATPIPIHFHLGDSIPTFSVSRRKYGTKRKPPPSPIGFLVQQKCISQQQSVEARLTIFAGIQHTAPLEDLMNRLPVNKKGDSRVSYASDGRNSLLARLEMEMGQQEQEWMGMHKTLERNSIGSIEGATEQRAPRLSRDISECRSSLRKDNEGILINRRLSTVDTESVRSDAQPSAWHAQMSYLVQAPLMNPGAVLARPTSILESQNTPISIVSNSDTEAYDSGDESPYGTNHSEIHTESCYGNDNLNFTIEENGGLEHYAEYEETFGDDSEIQLLEPTVYCPSTRSTSIISHSNFIYSVTSESFSRSARSPPISFLWNTRPIQGGPPPVGSQLWSNPVFLSKSPLALPAALDLRPKRRISTAPITKATTSLWVKAYGPQIQPSTGLWRSPREQKPKSIIAPPPGHTRSRLLKLKRVTFVEEVVTVETTGFFGKLKKLWGGHTKSHSDDSAAAPIYLRDADTAIDSVIVRYANEMLLPLPSLPPKTDIMVHKERENTACNHLWLHQPSPPTIIQPSLLWNQTHEQQVQSTQLFIENIPSLRRKAPQQTFLPSLTSNRLWGYVEQPTMPTLWLTSTASTRYLWPYGEGTAVRSYLWPSAPVAKKIEVSRRSRSRAITRLTRLTRLQSASLWVATASCKNGRSRVTTLWEPAGSGGNSVSPQKQELILWIKRQHVAPVASGHLWPNAPELPMLLSSLPAIRARIVTTELPVLESNQLWTFAKEAIGLWSPPVRSTGLWPHGGREKVASFLWPSASALDYILAKAASKCSRLMTAELEKFESEGLWSYSDVQLEPVEAKGMWKAATVAAKPTVVEQNTETLTSLLWTAPEKAPTVISLPGGLWGSVPVLLPRLWSAPVTGSELWPHGRPQHAQTRALWPSARPLASTAIQSLHNARIIITGLQIESSRLWSRESVIKAELWVPSPKKTGLWPNGQVVKSKSVGLWPSNTELSPLAIVSIRQVKQRSPINLATLESRELWSNYNAKQSLWKQANGQSGLWPQGAYNLGRRRLWSADSNMQTVPRRNLTLKLATIDGRKRNERKAITAILESRALWSRPVHTRPKSAGRLWAKKVEYIGELPRTKTAELREKDDVASVSPGLWANPSPASSPSPANLMTPVAVLWTAFPPKAPRIGFTICRETIAVAAVTITQRRKSTRATNLMPPLQGNLWAAGAPSLLPGGSTPRTGMKQAPQDGLWNSAGIHAKLEKKVPLWHRHTVIGKDRGAVKQQTLTTDTTRSFAAVKSDQLRSFISAETEDGVNHVHHDGLWHPTVMTKQAKERLLTADTIPRERTLVTPRTYALWEKNKSDKPLAPIFPASVMIIPEVPSRSNKRAASNIPPPLFLARVGGPMWTADKTSESRPRGLWRQTKNEGTGTKKGLWHPNNIDKYSTLTVINQATLPEKKSYLWSFSGIKPKRQSIFQNLSVESIRRSTSTTTRNHKSTINPMEGSLWVKSRNTTPEKPKLWRKAEIPQRLWAADNNVNSSTTNMTITARAVPTVATTHLWGKDNVTTTPIFADLSLESSRSRREFTPKAFSAPPEGLWKMALTSEPLEMVSEVPKIGLWGTDAALVVVKNVPTKTLWQKDNTETPLFADIPLESFRSKKDHSTATLPVFSEGMWKKKVALPERPQLWKPITKATGLWDANAKTKTLAQISLERKAKGAKKPLWSKERASRTTTKVPQRSPLAIVRISDDLTLPKATGDLWKPTSPMHQAPVLWTAPKPVIQSVKPAKPTAILLWGQGSGSKTTAAVAERTKVPFIPSDAPLAQVSGSLWKPKSADKPIGLWKRPIKTVAVTTVTPSVPLWTARTASRTTSAVPQRLPVPKKKDTRSIILPLATGSLWQPPKRTPEKGLWKAPAPPTRRPRSASLLWASHSAARTTTATPVRTTVPKRLIEEPLKTVGGTLWKAPSNEAKKGLWKRTIPTVATYRKTSTTSLWSKESASRTTSAKPDRAPFVPKVIDEKSLTLSPATGDLWMHPSSTTSQTVSLWSRPVTPSGGSGVWDARGRTPTLAEIKLALATRRDKTELWQRRSVLTSKPAIVDISKATPSSNAPQKKVKIAEPAPIPQMDGSLWRPCVDGKNEQGIMWITRSSRSSSLESEFISPGVSRASTISDMSDETESPLTTSNADAFEPEVMRIHSTKVSVSSAAGENMWRPIGAAEGKGKGVSRSDQKEQELPTWRASHSLWSKPSTDEEKAALWENPNSYACSSVSDEDFASAASELSEESHYHDFETSHDPDSYLNNMCPSSSSNPHVFVGQFQRDNYLLHQQSNTQLPENSPFASNLRIKSLRRKLRPTNGACSTAERKRRNTEGEEERERLKVDSIPMERAVSMGEEHL